MNLKLNNNFDLIRLFAAMQVAIVHASIHLEYENYFISILKMFPGVPIFFFISGFLIFASFEKSNTSPNPLRNFFFKRILRLYPALLLCLVFSVFSIWFNGYLEGITLNLKDFLIWVLAQATFLQFYNPEFLRAYGIGVINGSLWTVSVELQFYILMPLIFILIKKNCKYLLLFMLITLVLVNFLNNEFNPKETFEGKLLNVSFIPWLYMFLIGSLFFYYKKYLIPLIHKVHFIPAFILYWLTNYPFSLYGYVNNSITIFSYLALVILIMKCALKFPSLSNTILKKNDFSYGIYIFHMPIINYVIYKGYNGSLGFVLSVFITIILAIISWFAVERPCLRMKKYELRNL